MALCDPHMLAMIATLVVLVVAGLLLVVADDWVRSRDRTQSKKESL